VKKFEITRQNDLQYFLKESKKEKHLSRTPKWQQKHASSQLTIIINASSQYRRSFINESSNLTIIHVNASSQLPTIVLNASSRYWRSLLTLQANWRSCLHIMFSFCMLRIISRKQSSAIFRFILFITIFNV